MRFEKFSFGSIQIDGSTYEHDVIVDRGEIRKRKKKPSKHFREQFGHTPLSVEEKIPWKCRQLVIDQVAGAADHRSAQGVRTRPATARYRAEGLTGRVFLG